MRGYDECYKEERHASWGRLEGRQEMPRGVSKNKGHLIWTKIIGSLISRTPKWREPPDFVETSIYA